MNLRLESVKEYLKLKIASDFKKQVYDFASEIDPEDAEDWSSLAYGYALAAVRREPNIDVDKIEGLSINEFAGLVGLYIDDCRGEWELER